MKYKHSWNFRFFVYLRLWILFSFQSEFMYGYNNPHPFMIRQQERQKYDFCFLYLLRWRRFIVVVVVDFYFTTVILHFEDKVSLTRTQKHSTMRSRSWTHTEKREEKDSHIFLLFSRIEERLLFMHFISFNFYFWGAKRNVFDLIDLRILQMCTW